MEQKSAKSKVSVSIVIVGLFVSSMVLLPASIRPAHGQFTGLVCLSAVTTSCPSSPPTFTGSVGSQITVNVVIQGSDAFNGFDISVRSDPTIINPTSISTAGNVFSGKITFTVNDTTQNGVARLVVAANSLTPNPTTGLLFSITYNITGTSSGTPISYLTGCSQSSVAGTTDCVQVANGATNTNDPETDQAATFANTSGFIITASSSSLSISRGSSGSVTITITSTGGFSGTVNLFATVSPLVRHGPSAALNPSSVMVGPTTPGTSSLTVSALHSTPSGSYAVTVTASSGTISHSATIQVTVR